MQPRNIQAQAIKAILNPRAKILDSKPKDFFTMVRAILRGALFSKEQTKTAETPPSVLNQKDIPNTTEPAALMNSSPLQSPEKNNARSDLASDALNVTPRNSYTPSAPGVKEVSKESLVSTQNPSDPSKLPPPPRPRR